MNCPICKKPVTPRDDPKSPNPFFPFCSDRCKLIDLGRWLGGKYQIPVELDENDPSDVENSPDRK
jgi:endogenous inhibitor of DNA gyrase (YacG/DUF329 family)